MTGPCKGTSKLDSTPKGLELPEAIPPLLPPDAPVVLSASSLAPGFWFLLWFLPPGFWFSLFTFHFSLFVSSHNLDFDTTCTFIC